MWGSLALARYAGSFLCVVGGRQRACLGLGLWRLGPWTLLWYGIIFGIATIPLNRSQNYVTAQILPADILKALWLVAIAISAMAAGFLAGPSGPARRVSSRGLEALSRRFAFEVRRSAVPWVLCVIGLVANVAVTAATGVFGYVGSTVASLNMATGYQQYMALFCSVPAACGRGRLRSEPSGRICTGKGEALRLSW